jgi:hypothetical protein
MSFLQINMGLNKSKSSPKNRISTGLKLTLMPPNSSKWNYPKSNMSFGPSVVRALPLAAGINEGGHYFAYIILVRAKCVRPAEQLSWPLF